MATRIQLRRDTLANWELVNPILGDGEIIIVKIGNDRKTKIGDGTSRFNDLEYVLLEGDMLLSGGYIGTASDLKTSIDNIAKKTKDTVASMRADTTLELGDVVETLGYTTVNDSLGRKYIITAIDVDNLGITVGSNFASKFYDDNTLYVGKIEYIPFSTPPLGYLKCNGAAISRTTYARLFSAIGTTYGSGDGSTTFNLPDLRGIFLRGLDEGRGFDSGRTLGSYQEDELELHRHLTYDNSTYKNAYTGAEGSYLNSTGNYQAVYTGYTGGTETRPKNVAMIPIIKY